MDELVSIDSPWDLASGCLPTEDLFASITFAFVKCVQNN